MWVYRGFDWHAELANLRDTQWRWVYLAILADIAVYVCQGFRWSTLLRPLAKVSPWKTTQAVYIGLFANEVLPLRSGEIIRCYLQRRWTGLPLSVVISSAIIERLLDGIWLVLWFWIAHRYVALPNLLVQGSRVLMVLLFIVGGLMAVAIFYKHHAHGAVSRSRWAEMLRPLVDGVNAMGDSLSFVAALALSLLYLLLQILPIYFLSIGYGIDLTAWEAAVVLVVLRLGTIVPQAPGNVGSFQALTVLAMKILGVAKADATGYATLLFVVVTAPLWVAGFIALLATRMRLGEIHQEAKDTFANR